MKKLLGFLFLIMFLFPVLVFGAGSSFAILSDVTNRSGGDGHYIRTLTLKFVADDTDGSIPDLTLNASTTSIDRPLSGTGRSRSSGSSPSSRPAACRGRSARSARNP